MNAESIAKIAKQLDRWQCLASTQEPSGTKGQEREKMIHRGNSNGLAIRSQQETADILFRRGLIPKPDKKIIQWLERNALAKIRALHPELAAEIESGGSDSGGVTAGRGVVERVY